MAIHFVLENLSGALTLEGGKALLLLEGTSPPLPPVKPDAPTIGTAIAGNASATVSYALHGDGGSPITSVNAISNPGGFSGAGSGGAALVSGLANNGPAYTFTVVATNAVGDSLPSAASNSVTPTGGVGGPTAPSNLQLVLMGQNAADSTSSAPTPQNPNRQDISWSAATPGSAAIASYKIYRSVNGGAFTLYASPAGLGTTYSDTVATLCVNGTAGSTPPYYAANTYLYKVSAVDTNAAEGPQSGTQDFIIYKNGYRGWNLDYAFGGSPNYSDNTGAPQGGTNDILFTNSGFGGMLPVSSHLVTQWNFPVGAFKYLYLDLKAINTPYSFKVYALRVGDVKIYNAAGVSYNVNPMSNSYGSAPVVGQWSTRKIPLVDFLTDWGPPWSAVTAYTVGMVATSGGASYRCIANNTNQVPPNATFWVAQGGILQNALYKFAVMNDESSNGNFYADNLRLSAT